MITNTQALENLTTGITLKDKLPEYEWDNPDLEAEILTMTAIMQSENGIGLAATQVGIKTRMFLFPAKEDGKTQVAINPKITNKYGKIKVWEGCLSFPNIQVKVLRSKTIAVEYYDKDQNLIKETLNGMRSICFQHENAHLEGITFKQRALEIRRK